MTLAHLVDGTLDPLRLRGSGENSEVDDAATATNGDDEEYRAADVEFDIGDSMMEDPELYEEKASTPNFDENEDSSVNTFVKWRKFTATIVRKIWGTQWCCCH
ncbi:hypothetical protein GN244_ATG18591 [Phytophthora infestans]|uniref:Uncharacterized protein n=1 Tax=Phytophthora infestans TaxID=4787 RepID=A0A833WJW9_PHYIN|nr:hypothetical protein GN244_ATG18591 [Phytophthora infestans]KAF4143646.1 hypothetical protein GN958_ATG07166 [Phytophthora infestans]